MEEKNKEKKTLTQKIYEVGLEVGKIKKNKENPYYKSKYFDINQLLEAINPILKDKGLSINQPLDTEVFNEKPFLVLKTVITDGKEEKEYKAIIPQQKSPQDMGSAITYYRRYSLQSLFGLQAEDDDGNNASKKEEEVKTAEDVV